MKVIIADDSLVIRKIISKALNSLGYEALQATNGPEALEILNQAGTADLILLDWNMPLMDGFEVLTAIRNDNRFNAIPIIMVTTESEEENIAKAMESGANGYVTKPFTADDLTTKIREILG